MIVEYKVITLSLLMILMNLSYSSLAFTHNHNSNDDYMYYSNANTKLTNANTNSIRIISTSTTAGRSNEMKKEFHSKTKSKSNFKLFQSIDENMESLSTMSDYYDWSDVIDACYLITCPNADEGAARLKKSMEVLEEVNLLNNSNSKVPTIIKKFDTDDEDRIRGCYTSHIEVLKEAHRTMKSNCENSKSGQGTLNVLVVEDNVALTENGNVDLRQLITRIEDFKGTSSFDVLHLAYICYVPNLKVTKTDVSNIVKLSSGVGSSLGTTAYIISLQGMEAVLAEDNARGYYYVGRAIPDVMAEIFPETRYALYPVPFHRASKVKSLVNPQLDSLREVLFEPAIIVKVQSILAETGLSTNTLLPIIIFLLLGLSGTSLRISLDAAYQISQTGSYDGILILPIISSVVSLFVLAIIGQGVALAPKPQQRK